MNIWDTCDKSRKCLDSLENIREDILRLEAVLKSGILIETHENMYKLTSEVASANIERIRMCIEKLILMVPATISDENDEAIKELYKLEKLIHEFVDKINKGDGVELKVIRKYTDFTKNNNQLSFWK